MLHSLSAFEYLTWGQRVLAAIHTKNRQTGLLRTPWFRSENKSHWLQRELIVQTEGRFVTFRYLEGTLQNHDYSTLWIQVYRESKFLRFIDAILHQGILEHYYGLPSLYVHDCHHSLLCTLEWTLFVDLEFGECASGYYCWCLQVFLRVQGI